jgi:hypothetical protein
MQTGMPGADAARTVERVRPETGGPQELRPMPMSQRVVQVSLFLVAPRRAAPHTRSSRGHAARRAVFASASLRSAS